MDRIRIEKKTNLGSTYFPWETMDYCGKCRGYEIYLDRSNNMHTFTVIDPDPSKVCRGTDYKIVAEIQLERSYSTSWQCSFTRIDSKYQGNNLAMYFYKFVMRLGYVLEAGHAQSAGSRKLWWKLSKDRNVVMIAKEKYSREGWIMPERNNSSRELTSDFFDIYDGAKEVNVYALCPQ